ncbi:hypothetical protein B0H14DRAFT_1386065 [Mycena olivaceomarginata]|nr:hypothetical protein B0H14DRAFT_1386065 [Mycena olivaceomarginata]
MLRFPSSSATVHAARWHRALTAQMLGTFPTQAEGLRREVNEWHARPRAPQLDAPVRSHAHTAVCRAEVEDFDLTLEEGLELEEDEGEGQGEHSNDDDARYTSVSPQVASTSTRASTVSTPGSTHGYIAFYTPASTPCTFKAPSSPSPSPASSALWRPIPLERRAAAARGEQGQGHSRDVYAELA